MGEAPPVTVWFSGRLRRRAYAAAGVLIVVMTLIAYVPAMRGGFIWDDDEYVENNTTLESVEGLKQIWTEPRSLPQWYPMVHTTYWVEYRLWGLRPAGYKVVNVLLHSGTAVLLWALLRRLNVPGAWLCAAVFALHPVHVESVAWITERKNTLSGFFYLGAMFAYVRMLGTGWEEPPKRAWRSGLYWVALGLFVLALLSKTVTCSLPAAVLLVVYWKRGKITAADVWPLVPFFVIGVGLAYTTAHLEATHVGAGGPEFALSWGQRVIIAGRALWFYAWKLVYPFGLTFIYPKWRVDAGSPVQWLYPVSFVLTVGALWYFRGKLTRAPLVAVLFFAGTLVPALGFVDVYPMRYSYVADHFQYLASIGLLVLMVGATEYMSRVLDQTVETSPARKWLKHALMTDIPFVLPMLWLTFQQGKIYQDRFTLWTDTVHKNPGSWMAHLNLGHAYVSVKGDGVGALAEYRNANELAPDVADPYYNIGYRMAVEGKYEEAVKYYDEALAREPRFPQALFARGNAYKELKQYGRAIENYSKAIEMQPRFVEARLNLGHTYELTGQKELAEKEYRAALVMQPGYRLVRQNLASVLRDLGRDEEAGRVNRGEWP